MNIPVEVSGRHCHLSKAVLEKLFGQGYELKVFKQLSQPSDFAAAEKVVVEVNGKTLEEVRIVGPLRNETQIEISKTDAFFLGVNPPIRLSGDLGDSLPVKLIGPAGEVMLDKGLMVALRHIHCSQEEAKQIGIKNGDVVAVQIDSERSLVFRNVLVRVNDNYKLCMHIDADEGNAAGINKIGQGIIL